MQQYCKSHAARLLEAGLHYLTPGDNVPAANPVAQTILRNNPEQIRVVGQRLATRYHAHSANLISGELFVICNPARVADMMLHYLPVKASDITIVLYLRRQDLFLESNFRHRFLNGKINGNLTNFITRMMIGHGLDYFQLAKAWQQAFPEAKLVLRLYETSRLIHQNSVEDFFHAIGKAHVFVADAEMRLSDPQPNGDVMQLLMMASRTLGVDVGRLKDRLLRMSDLPQTGAPRSFMSLRERGYILKRFAQSNEALRAEFFPQQTALFEPPVTEGIEAAGTSLSPEQLKLIRAFFEAMRES